LIKNSGKIASPGLRGEGRVFKIMDFAALKNEVKSLGLDELRTDKDDYFEVVVIRAELEKLGGSLEKFLGVPVNVLSAEMKKAIGAFGGIMAGQTLYFSHQDSNIVFAMLWPWKDGVHITVKIVSR
jgi:hypothetical protein